MQKFEQAFRAFIVIARIGAGALLLAGPASASTYTMQDYYNALAAVDNDNQNISNLEGDIASIGNQIAWADDYYSFQVSHSCSGALNSGNGTQPNWYAYQDCIDGWNAEWSGVVSSLYADQAAAEMALAFAYAQLGTDQGTLALIMSDLGLS